MLMIYALNYSYFLHEFFTLSFVCFVVKVFGLYIVKLSVALVLIGGVAKVEESGTRIRGECHMLIVGDPGTGQRGMARCPLC